MSNNAEKASVMLVVGVLVFMSISYTVTGDFISNPADWINQIKYKTYDVSFNVERCGDISICGILGSVYIDDLEIGEKESTLSLAEMKGDFGICLGGYFKGSVVTTVENPSGYKENIIYDPDISLCRGDSNSYSDSFYIKQSGVYKIDIAVKDNNGDVVASKSKNIYIDARR